MIDPELRDKVVLVTGGNNPFGIGAAVAKAFSSHGAHLFIHYFRQQTQFPHRKHDESRLEEPGFGFYYKQQGKTADKVEASVRKYGCKAESWEGDLRSAEKVTALFERAERAFGHIDVLVNNAAEYFADTFVPPSALGEKAKLWEGGPTTSMVDAESCATSIRGIILRYSNAERGPKMRL